MNKWWLFGVLGLLGNVAAPARAQWGYPPPGYRPPAIVQPDGTVVPCADRYGLCSAWRRKHGVSASDCAGYERRPLFDRIRARCGLEAAPCDP